MIDGVDRRGKEPSEQASEKRHYGLEKTEPPPYGKRIRRTATAKGEPLADGNGKGVCRKTERKQKNRKKVGHDDLPEMESFTSGFVIFVFFFSP